MDHPKPAYGNPQDPDPLESPPAEPASPSQPPESFDEVGGGAGAESRGLTDMLRKAMVAGLGAVFMTEEGIRTYVKDLKLPKDAVGYVLGQAERSKGELFRVIGEELHRFFESELLRREIVRLLSEVTIDVHAEIRLKPQGAPPEIKVHSATARRSRKKKD